MSQDFIDSLTRLEYSCKFVGISRRNHNRLVWLRRFLLIILGSDLLLSSFVSLFINNGPDRSYLWPDIPFWISSQKRPFFSMIIFLQRARCIAVLFVVHWDDLDWLKHFNQVFSRITDSETRIQVEQLALKCRRQMFRFEFVAFASILTNHLFILLVVRKERNREESWMLSTHVELIIFNLAHASLRILPYGELYFFCKTSIILFRMINRQFLVQVIQPGHLQRFPYYYQKLRQAILMTSMSNKYIGKIFIILLACLLPEVAVIFNSIMKVDQASIFDVIYLLLGFNLILFMFYLSNLIGRVDSVAKRMTKPFYRRFVLEKRANMSSKHRFLVLNYLYTMQSTNISLTIWNVPIDLNFSLTVFTFFFTIYAVVMNGVRSRL